MKELIELLKDYEKLEADIIENGNWNTNSGFPEITREQYKLMIELQGNRNILLNKYKGKIKEDGEIRMKGYTGFKDHTGAKLYVGDECTVDSEDAHYDDWKGEIFYIDGRGYFFRYHDDGDVVPLHKIRGELEKKIQSSLEKSE